MFGYHVAGLLPQISWFKKRMQQLEDALAVESAANDTATATISSDAKPEPILDPGFVTGYAAIQQCVLSLACSRRFPFLTTTTPKF
jgi:hypothetical protein